jgi:CGNR zinc finger
VYTPPGVLDIQAHDTTPAAPGDLEVAQRFLNLHDHAEGLEGDRPPPPAMVREYLVRAGLLDAGAAYTREDHENALALYRALHERVRARDLGGPMTGADATLEGAARRADLRPRFAGGPGLEPSADGVDGALGRLLAVVFVAEMHGTWSHVKECASRTCTAVFYDRSKNRSGKWCSMRSCGNKHKVRAWRRRQQADVVGD